MGLYDSFEIDYPLPLEDWIPAKIKNYAYHTFSADGFQCKDLDCLLENYYIDNNGFIFKDEETYWFKKPEKEIKKNKIYFHGHINVYTPVWIDYEDEINKGPMVWFEYDLKFTDGLLVYAKMISPKKEEINELHRYL